LAFSSAAIALAPAAAPAPIRAKPTIANAMRRRDNVGEDAGA